MSRAHLYRTVQSLGGNLVTGASVQVCEAGTTTPIAQTMYTDENSQTVLGNPINASTGLVDLYLNQAQDVALVITYGSSTLTVDYQSVLPPANEVVSVITITDSGTGVATIGTFNDTGAGVLVVPS